MIIFKYVCLKKIGIVNPVIEYSLKLKLLLKLYTCIEGVRFLIFWAFINIKIQNMWKIHH